MEMKGRFNDHDSLRATFNMFDRDGDGKITAKELKEMLGSNEKYKNMPENFWADIIREVDTNGDGEVDGK